MASSSNISLSRRALLARAGINGLGALFLSVPLLGAECRAQKTTFSTNPFTLGVASGDPTSDGIVLWTRLAPDPLNGGGMPPGDVPVSWRIAKDDKLKNVVKQGTAVASDKLGHSVHVEVSGLEPGRWYWYQFSVGGMESAVGRTKTAPRVGASVQKVTFASVSCQNWQDGFFNAHQHLAQDDLDLVVHLGDYIYESGINKDKPRQHNSVEPADLEGYRNRYALYKSDKNLQAAHAAFPWIVTWDDHEVENNYANLHRDNLNPPGDFTLRRAAAYQAYYEHQPLRRSQIPVGPDLLLYRRLAFGDLIDMHVLDTRQYRAAQTTQDKRHDAAQVILGKTQEDWLTSGMDKSRARWNVMAQQIFLSQRDLKAGPETSYSMDAWDGYADTRDRLMRFLAARKPNNPIVLSGDVHNNWAAHLKADFNEPKSAVVGAEFVCTSISSGGDGADTNKNAQSILSENEHIRFFNGQRGYVKCTVTPALWKTEYRVVPQVTQPGAPIFTRAAFVVENGRPGMMPVGKG